MELLKWLLLMLTVIHSPTQLEEPLDPLECMSSNTVEVQFVEKLLVIYTVESLAKIEQENISLLFTVDVIGPVVYCFNELCFTGQFLAKAMLLVNQNVVI